MPALSDGEIEYCSSKAFWSRSPASSVARQFPYHASDSFDMDVNSDKLRLFSRGSQQYGVVHIKQSDGIGNKICVDVVFGSHNEKLLDRTAMFHLKREGNDHGIGIFTPTVIGGIHTQNDRLWFDVTFTFPGGDGRLWNIQEFETDTPFYEYKMDQLNKVFFKNISLKTVNASISVGAIVAEVGSFETSNSNIKGHFNATSRLTLRTSNGPITGTVDISNDPTSGTEYAVALETSNSRINTSIKLTSTNGTHGLFKVDATTSNDPVNLSYAYSPVDSTLKCNVHSSNSRVDIRMYQAFEGGFEVSTSNSHASVERLDKEDPSGEERRRVVRLTRNPVRGQVSGNLYWQDGSHRGSGFVKVSTSNGAATLTL
ncbi:hypothetical protein BJ138DRAFT_1101101 [Hygrophoropsis aurantiaca]|uniref:Uncharacterized protein n=1 Tax=Hygrophoropsis aurantiaca TaxID=72124 RepID=A0ACB8AD22_9AGAM|nr:hypothetical protein BJ138DRAFT_1101101 [Hygrophoropsis aurantiaca]